MHTHGTRETQGESHKAVDQHTHATKHKSSFEIPHWRLPEIPVTTIEDSRMFPRPGHGPDGVNPATRDKAVGPAHPRGD